jgi:glutathione S-transferase
MSLKLHAIPPSPRAFKVLLAANHLGIDYEL